MKVIKLLLAGAFVLGVNGSISAADMRKELGKMRAKSEEVLKEKGPLLAMIENMPRDLKNDVINQLTFNNPHFREEMLMTAAFFGNKEIADLMIKAGANINQWDKDSNTALSFAASEGHKGIVDLLINEGAQLDKQDIDGYTALMWAALKGHTDIVKMLIGKADLSKQDKNGNTAFNLAANEEIAEILKNAGAKG